MAKITYNDGKISIHALREEGDLTDSLSITVSMIFLSTPSARRATVVMRIIAAWSTISIHALREEGDSPGSKAWEKKHDFYPRPPRGGRQAGESVRRTYLWISIHALREEGDRLRP